MADRSSSRLPLVILALTLAVVFYRLLMGEVFFWGLPSLQFVPWREYAFSLIRAGQLPLWNPFNGAGAPLLANYQSALLYPLNWPEFILPLAWSMSVTAVLHLFIGGWGMWRFTGRLGVSSLGRGVGALAFGMTSYIVARLGTFPMVSAAAWLPWLMWAALGVLSSGGRRAMAWLALFAGLQLLAGHAQTAWYSMLLVGLFSAWWLWKTPPPASPTLRIQGGESETPPPTPPQTWGGERTKANSLESETPPPTPASPTARIRGGESTKRLSGKFIPGEKIRRLAMVAGLLALGAGIAALQLLPTAELLRQSQRSGGVDYDFAMNFSYAPARILNLLSPNVFGNPGDGSYLTKGAFFEDAVYVGLIPLIGAIAAFFGWWQNRRRSDRPPVFASVPLWWGAALVALIFALGKNTPIFPFLYRSIPTFNLFQAPVRWHLWTVFSLSVLAGIGVSAWGRSYRLRRWTTRAMVAAVGAVVVSVLGAVLAKGSPPGVQLLIRAVLFTGALGIGACLLTLRQPPSDHPRYGRWSLLVLLVVAVDLGWASWGLNPTAPASFYDARPPLGFRLYWPKAVEQNIKFETYFLFTDYRYATDHQDQVRQTNLPNLNLLDRTPLLNNFDPLLVGGYADLIDAIEAASPDQRANLLRAAGVSAVYNDDGTLQTSPQGLTGLAWTVDSICWRTIKDDLKAAMLDAAWNPLAQAQALGDGGCPAPSNEPPGQITSFDQQATSVEIHVQMQRDGWLVLADTDYPGWQASVDSQAAAIQRVNLAFRAVQIAAGEHIVRFDYRPRWLLPGAVISFIALLVTVVLFRTKTLPPEA